jgi:hypothetical protein
MDQWGCQVKVEIKFEFHGSLVVNFLLFIYLQLSKISLKLEV